MVSFHYVHCISPEEKGFNKQKLTQAFSQGPLLKPKRATTQSQVFKFEKQEYQF